MTNQLTGHYRFFKLARMDCENLCREKPGLVTRESGREPLYLIAAFCSSVTVLSSSFSLPIAQLEHYGITNSHR
jgi:hypothetical protein